MTIGWLALVLAFRFNGTLPHRQSPRAGRMEPMALSVAWSCRARPTVNVYRPSQSAVHALAFLCRPILFRRAAHPKSDIPILFVCSLIDVGTWPYCS